MDHPDLTGFKCQPGYTCPAGSHSSMMTRCPAGKYTSALGSVSCLDCPSGFYCNGDHIDPVLCPQGHYCPAGTIAPIKCPAGTFGQRLGLRSQSECT